MDQHENCDRARRKSALGKWRRDDTTVDFYGYRDVISIANSQDFFEIVQFGPCLRNRPPVRD